MDRAADEIGVCLISLGVIIPRRSPSLDQAIRSSKQSPGFLFDIQQFLSQMPELAIVGEGRALQRITDPSDDKREFAIVYAPAPSAHEIAAGNHPVIVKPTRAVLHTVLESELVGMAVSTHPNHKEFTLVNQTGVADTLLTCSLRRWRQIEEWYVIQEIALTSPVPYAPHRTGIYAFTSAANGRWHAGVLCQQPGMGRLTMAARSRDELGRLALRSEHCALVVDASSPEVQVVDGAVLAQLFRTDVP